MSEYDGFFKALSNLGAELKQKRTAVQNDKDLSASGRQKVLGEIEAEYGAKVKDLQARYHKQHGTDRAGYDKVLNPPKPPSFKDRVLMKAKKAPVMELEYPDDTERAAALIESNNEVVSALEKSSYMNYAGRLTPEDFSKTAQTAYEAGDMDKLSHLREIAGYRGDAARVKSLDGYIGLLKEDRMTPRQKLARAHQNRLDVHKGLFDWGVEKVLTGGEFQDLRGGESDINIQLEIDTLTRQINAKE